MMRILLSCTLVLILSTQIRADVDSGPEKGAAIPKLEVNVSTGENAGKKKDHTLASKDGLAVYLFVAADKFDRPMHRYFKGLDEKIDEKIPAVVVWLTEDEDKTKQLLPRVQMSVQYQHLILSYLPGKEGPKDWNINTDAHLTVIIAEKGKVLGRWGYQSVNDTDLPPVLKVLKK